MNIIIGVTMKRRVAKHVARVNLLTSFIHNACDVHWDLYDAADHMLPLDTWTSSAVAMHKLEDVTPPHEIILDLNESASTRAHTLALAVCDMRRNGHIGTFVSFECGSFLHRTFVLLLNDQIIHVDTNGAASDLLKSTAFMVEWTKISSIPIHTMPGSGLQQTCKSDSCLVLSVFLWVHAALAWRKKGMSGALRYLTDVFRRRNHPTVLRRVWVWGLRLSGVHISKK